jgi:hypothetical protein
MLSKRDVLTSPNLNNAYLSKINTNSQTVVGPVSFSSTMAITGNTTITGSLRVGLPGFTLASAGSDYHTITTVKSNELGIQPHTYFNIYRGYNYTSSYRKLDSSDVVFAIDNANSYFKLGGVGIGVSNVKGQNLFLSGSMGIDYSAGGGTSGSALRMSTDANGSYIQTNQYYSSGNKYARAGYSDLIEMDTNTGDIVFSTAPNGAADAAMSYTERLRIKQGGAIGMGTSSPTGVLEVARALTTSGPDIVVRNDIGSDTWNTSGAYNGGLIFANRDTDNTEPNKYTSGIRSYSEWGGWGGDLRFYTKHDETSLQQRMVIDEYGKVGINTTTPAEKLQVNGVVYVAGGSAGSGLRLKSETSVGGYGGSIYFSNDDGSQQRTSRIRSYYQGRLAFEHSQTLQTYNADPTALTYGTPSIVINTTNGNVGIGQYNPSSKLHVDNGDITVTNTAASGATREISVSNIYSGAGLTAAIGVSSATGNPGTYLRSIGGDPLQLRSGTTVLMHLKGDGKIGIGNTNPADLLTLGAEDAVASNRRTIRINSGGYAEPGARNVASNGDKIILYDNASYDGRIGVGSRYNLWMKSIGENGNGSLEFYTGDGTEKMRIDNAGRVGIKKVPISYPLEVNGEALIEGWLRTSGNTGWFNETYSGGWYMENSTWVRNYNKPVLINQPGDTTLAIQNPNATEYSAIRFYDSVGNNPSAIHQFNQSHATSGAYEANSLVIQSGNLNLYANSSIKFFTNGSADLRMVISATGNVGIGTTNSSWNLTVAGRAAEHAYMNLIPGDATHDSVYLIDAKHAIGYYGGWNQSTLYINGIKSFTNGVEIGSVVGGYTSNLSVNGDLLIRHGTYAGNPAILFKCTGTEGRLYWNYTTDKFEMKNHTEAWAEVAAASVSYQSTSTTKRFAIEYNEADECLDFCFYES